MAYYLKSWYCQLNKKEGEATRFLPPGRNYSSALTGS